MKVSITVSINFQYPRYRPWITASKMLHWPARAATHRSSTGSGRLW